MSTDEVLNHLKWIRDREPVSHFNHDKGPNLILVKKLVDEGFVSRLPDLVPHPKIKNAALSAFCLSRKGTRLVEKRFGKKR